MLGLDSSVREAEDKTKLFISIMYTVNQKTTRFSVSEFILTKQNHDYWTSSSGNTSTPIKFVSGNLYIKNNNMVTFYTNRKLRNPIKLRLWNVTAD